MPKARIADIIHHATVLSNVTAEDLRGLRRHRGIARVRQAVCLVANEHGHPYAEIGRRLGRDHSTVIHAVRTAAYLAEREPGYGAFVAELRRAAEEGGVFAAEAYAYRPYVPPPRYTPTFHFRLPPPKPVTNGDPDGSECFHAGIAEGSRRLAEAIMLARAA